MTEDHEWIEPNEGAPAHVDLGDGHTLTWTTYQGETVGGIIRHRTPVSEKFPLGYCDSAFWLRGNKFTASEPDRPQWDLSGEFKVPTLSPSFLCHCGDHGWIREGKWIRA
jgi:hypothetical protein